MTSSIVCQELKQNPRETHSNLEPEEHLVCVLKDNSVENCSLDQDDATAVDNVDGYERPQGHGSFEEVYCYESEVKFEYNGSEPQDDPLAVDVNYIKQESLWRHLTTIHSKEKPFQCKLCSFGTGWFASFKRHMKIHSGNKQYKCNLCPYTTSYAKSVWAHIKTHSETKPYKCVLCPFKSRYSSCLRAHMITHSENKPYTCNLCSFSSKYASSLKHHVSTHSGFKPFQCTICPYSTGWANALKGHMAKHLRGKPDKRFQCAHCNQRFYTKLTLSEHIMRMHMHL